MILSKTKIIQEIENGNITFKPFKYELISDVSIDITLGNHLVVYKNKVLDSKKDNPSQKIEIPETGYKLETGKFYLAFGNEFIGTDKYAMQVWGKSSIGRLALTVHNAGLGEPGFGKNEQWTLELIPTMDLIVYPNMKIAQITFLKVDGKISKYNGKYLKQLGATVSRNFKDFDYKIKSN